MGCDVFSDRDYGDPPAPPGQIPTDIGNAIKARLDFLHEAVTNAYEAVNSGDLTGLTIIIRDMGWFIFAIDQHRQRIPKGQGNAH
jgi:hypothetical protein